MHEDEIALGVISPDIEPKATDSIEQMINMIELLITVSYTHLTLPTNVAV